MSDKTGNRVHLMYITVLVDLDRVKWYGWGSACLATLYREMCRATDPDAKTMGGYASLLQSWAWYRMAFIAARVNRKPLMRLDHMTVEQFLWNPYLHFLDVLESTAFVDSSI
ncbi:hypothetical protein JHK86_054807 [Glycine max]|nr:hypothetical protein JHK86_054807 [Glycine max]